MTDWTKQVVSRMRQLAEDKRIFDEKVLHDKKTRDAGLQHEWEELCKRLRQMCEDLNQESELGFKVSFEQKSPTQVRVGRLDSGATISGEINGPLYRYIFHAKAHGFEFGLELATDCQSWFLTDRNKPIQPVEMAQRVMGELLGI